MSKLNVVSWNVGKRRLAIESLYKSDFDIALIQEAPLASKSWEARHVDRGADILNLSDRAKVVNLTNIPHGRRPNHDEISTSAPGTIAVARVTPGDDEPILVVSLYARWEKPHPQTPTNWYVGYADAMAHRAISDLSALIGHTDPRSHRILVAGDFNLIHGALDSNPLALPARDRSVFTRLDSLGFEFLGPQFPNGRRAVPLPQGLPENTGNVPTYYTTHQEPSTAANQLDYVFASRGFHESISTHALNGDEEWGLSDHCQIRIVVDLG
ncbi:MAG: endonuclease/exonuclease/phosphatase family protein [Gammaproteobacteria bacterium]|nr:endonuclease/exonuclease/phosphatase family protein [Gammaproteobacteria bacterium]